jgi:hypothetical protein
LMSVHIPVGIEGKWDCLRDMSRKKSVDHYSGIADNENERI